jgi:hypothetical protein
MMMMIINELELFRVLQRSALHSFPLTSVEDWYFMSSLSLRVSWLPQLRILFGHYTMKSFICKALSHLVFQYHGRIILEWILGKLGGKACTG